MPAGGLHLERPKQKQRSLLLLCLPFFDWEGGAAPFFEVQLRGVARYAHPCAQRSKRRALSPLRMIIISKRSAGKAIAEMKAGAQEIHHYEKQLDKN